jgi:hypothetical protein
MNSRTGVKAEPRKEGVGGAGATGGLFVVSTTDDASAKLVATDASIRRPFIGRSSATSSVKSTMSAWR